MKPLFFFTSRNGHMIFPDRGREMLYKYLKANEGKEMEMTVSLRKKIRSNQQNKLHWARMTIIGNELGYTKEEMHFTFKKMILSDKISFLEKDQFMIYLQNIDKNLITTRILSTVEMAELTETIERQAGELGIFLPAPEDV